MEREIKRRISQHTSTWMVEVCAKTSQVMERVVRRASKVCHSSVCPGRWLIQATERTSEKKVNNNQTLMRDHTADDVFGGDTLRLAAAADEARGGVDGRCGGRRGGGR